MLYPVNNRALPPPDRALRSCDARVRLCVSGLADSYSIYELKRQKRYSSVDGGSQFYWITIMLRSEEYKVLVFLTDLGSCLPRKSWVLLAAQWETPISFEVG